MVDLNNSSRAHKDIWLAMLGIFFFWMLLSTGALQEIRGSFAILIFFLFFISVLLKETVIVYDKKVLFFSVAAVFVSLFSLGHGLVNGNLGALKSAGVYGVWPLVFLFMLGGIGNFRVFHIISKALILGSAVISILVLGKLVHDLVGLNYDGFWEAIRIRTGFFLGAIKISSPMLPVLFYFVPFSLTLILLSNGSSQRPLTKFWGICNVVSFFMSCLVLIMSGRGAAAIVLIFSVPVCIWVLPARKKIARRTAVSNYMFRFLFVLGGTYIILVVFAEFVDLVVYTELMIEKVFYVQEVDSVGYRRYEQFINLLGFIKANPFLGRGLGGVEEIGGSVWQFELSYISLLDQVGLVGFSIYSAGVLFLIRALIRIVRKADVASALASATASGLIVFLVVNATNPLLSKFDFLWVIFFPLALVNYTNTRRHNS
jgi:hypothetical protein